MDNNLYLSIKRENEKLIAFVEYGRILGHAYSCVDNNCGKYKCKEAKKLIFDAKV